MSENKKSWISENKFIVAIILVLISLFSILCITMYYAYILKQNFDAFKTELEANGVTIQQAAVKLDVTIYLSQQEFREKAIEYGIVYQHAYALYVISDDRTIAWCYNILR